MSELDHATSPQKEQIRRAASLSQTMAGNHLAFVGLGVYIAIQTGGAWQAYAIVLLALSAVIGGFVAANLIRRGEQTRGGWLLFTTTWIAPAGAAWVLANFSYISVGFILVSTYFIISFAMTRESQRTAWINLAAILLIPIAAQIIDPAWRLVSPFMLTASPIITAILAVALIVIVGRQILSRFNSVFQSLRVGQKIVAGSIITIALVAIIMAVVLINMNTLTNDFNFLVEHDQPVLSNIAELQKLQVDMETGERGFVITGEDEFLEPYNNAQDIFDSLIEEEKVLVSDNPPQVVRLEEIESLHNDWLRLAAEPEIAKRREVNLATTTTATLEETLATGVGKGILDELRGVLDQMESSFRAADNLDAAILAVQIGKDMVDQETGQRGFIITGEESFLEPYNASQERLADHIAELRVLLVDDPANRTRLDQVESLANDWVVKAGEPEIAARREVNANPATVADVAAMLEVGTGKDILDDMRVHFDEFTAIEVELNQQRAADAEQQAQTTAVLGISFTLLGIAITFFLGSYVARNITTSLDEVTTSAQKIIGGDLDVEVEIRSEDEVGQLAGTFNDMTSQLRETLGALDKRNKAQESVAEIATAVATIPDLQEMLERTVHLTQRGFDLYHAHVFSYHEDTQDLRIVACGYQEGDEHEGTHGMTSIPFGQEQSLVARAARNREAVIVNDVRNEPGWLPNPELPDTRAELAVPMVVGDKLLGVLDVQAAYTDAFTSAEANIQTTLAAQIATSMQNILQFESTQKVANDLSVVAEVGIATATITDKDQLLQEVVDLSKKSFDLYHAHIYLMNEAGDALDLTSGAGEVGRTMVAQGLSIALDREQSLVARAARTHEGVVVNDVTQDANFLPNPLLPETRAEMAVPMIVAGKVTGVLDVQAETVERFTDVDVNIQTTLASQIAVALENARSFEKTEGQAEQALKLNTITQKIQAADTIEEAMQVAARELGHALGKRQTMVSLNPSALKIDSERTSNE